MSKKKPPVKKWEIPEGVDTLIEQICRLSVTDKWVGLTVIAEKSDGEIVSGSTHTGNPDRMVGHLIRICLRIMGFQDGSK